MSNTAAFQPHALRRVQGANGCSKFALMDVLMQLMTHWSDRDRREHLRAFKDRDNLPPFARVYMPNGLGESRRKIANTAVAPIACVVDLICSLPCNPQHLIDCATALQRHCGVAPTSNLVCRPLQTTQLSREELLQRTQGTAARQPMPSSQEVCASVLSTLPAEAVTSKGHLFQYGHHSIHALRNTLGEPWFRATAVALAMGYNDPKAILSQHVCKQRKQKREKLPMTSVLSKTEREAIWINRQGVRDLVDARGHEEGELFWRWFADNVLPHVHIGDNQGHVLNALPQTPVYATEAAITEEQLQAYKQELQHRVLECQILQVQLARFVHTTCLELGLPTPPSLQAERLLNEATQQEVESRPAPTAEELNQLQWANERQEEMSSRLYRKILRLDLALKARRVANECGLPVHEAQLLAERQALEMAASPAHLDDGAWLTAGDYLRYARGHSEDEVQQLQTSFGRSLKAYQLQQGVVPNTITRDYGSNEVLTCIYHASRDRALLNAAYQAFALTDLYRQVVPPAVQAINNL